MGKAPYNVWNDAIMNKAQAWVRRIDIFELGTAAFLVLVGIYLSLPIFSILGWNSSFTLANMRGVSERAIVYAITGIFCFIFAYAITPQTKGATKASSIFRYEWDNKRAYFAFIALFFGGFALKLIRIALGQHLSNLYLDTNDKWFLFNFMISLNWLHYIGIAVAFVQYFSLYEKGDSRYKPWMYISWSAAVIAIICGLVSINGRAQLITPIIMYLIARHYLCDKSWPRIIIAAIVILVILFPLKIFMRDIASVTNTYFANQTNIVTYYSGPQTQRNVFNSVESLNFAELKSDQVNFNARNFGSLATDSTIGRIGQLHVFSVIVEKVKKFDHGKNILFALSYFGVPNAWIEKATGIGVGTDFGLKYGIVNDPWTGVAPTQFGDLFINFGAWGIFIGALIMGAVYKKIFCSLTANNYPSGIFIYSVLWLVMMHGLEQSLSAAYGAALFFFLIVFLVQLFISKADSRWYASIKTM